jgi:hypothetical protein
LKELAVAADICGRRRPMDRKTVLIVPATVPDARPTRVPAPQAGEPTVISAEPTPVPAPAVVPLIPEQLTAEQIAELREENEALRDELARVRFR